MLVRLTVWMAIALCGSALAEPLLLVPSAEVHPRAAAVDFNQHAKGALAPVYPFLADYVVQEFGLATAAGIGIDLGGGPGDAVLELARRTEAMYWIDADINPFHFEFLFRQAVEAGLSHRVGAIFADAQRLPFRDGYADLVISRGSFQFWGDTSRAFAEILRVLKPGGRAFIGRGLTPNIPLDVARALRQEQGGGPRYDLDETEALFRQLMADLGVQEFEILRPHREADVNYGIWVAFARPLESGDGR